MRLNPFPFVRLPSLFAAAFMLVAAPVLLAACSHGNPFQRTISVTLSGAQAEATALSEAVHVVESSVVSAGVLSPAAQKQAATALAGLDTAVKSFNGLSSGSQSIAAFAASVISAVQSVMAVVPLPGSTGVAVTTGLALLQALIAGLSTITVTKPASTAVGAAPTRIIGAHAPVPIPVPAAA